MALLNKFNQCDSPDDDAGTSTSGEPSVIPVRNADKVSGTSISGELIVSQLRNDPLLGTDLYSRSREQHGFSVSMTIFRERKSS